MLSSVAVNQSTWSNAAVVIILIIIIIIINIIIDDGGFYRAELRCTAAASRTCPFFIA